MIKMIPNVSNKTTPVTASGGNTVYWADTASSIKMPTYITDVRKYIKLDGTEELQVKMGGNWQRIDVQYEASEIMEKL